MTDGVGFEGPRSGTADGRSARRSRRPRAPHIDPLVVDRYLDSLLADGHPGAPAVEDPDVDPVVRRAVDRLRLELVRVHPSFRFEERLAARLADAAKRMKLPAAAGAEGIVVTIPLAALEPAGAGLGGAVAPGATPAQPVQPVLPAPTSQAVPGGLFAGLPDPSAVIAGLPRPLVIGGALTSAAISIAGAYMAWRARPQVRFDVIGAAGTLVARTRARLD